jgi:hypothetical protein
MSDIMCAESVILFKPEPNYLLDDPTYINTYDIDGVIWLPDPYVGLRPRSCDIIITGRSYEEETETYQYLTARGIFNEVHFNPIPFVEKTREKSAIHKIHSIKDLIRDGFSVGIHFEDDPLQAELIQFNVPEITVVQIRHNLVNLENERRTVH